MRVQALFFYQLVGKIYKMGKSKRKTTNLKKESETRGLDESSPIENPTTDQDQGSHVDTHDNKNEDPLKDRQGSPINIRPKGMDA